MFVYLSKVLPLFIYPLGLACVLMFIALLRRQQPRWQRGIIGLALLALWLGSSRWLPATLVRSLEWRYLPPAAVPAGEVIVVLGGGTRGNEYPRPTVEISEAGDRLLYAAGLYHQGVADHLLLTGGNVFTSTLHTDIPEAENMLTIMQMLNVPEEAVWLETKSRNTYQNALYSRPLLEERDIDTILLVTSAIHMPRSVALFEKQGFTVIPLPTDYLITERSWADVTSLRLSHQFGNALPTVENLQLTTWALKEYVGLVVYRLQGWL
ncbi:MAG: YdcF family protein [Ardenticatenaceae bacterium]|nr:YdcF family protein [Ardenticatenaceae bacterium]